MLLFGLAAALALGSISAPAPHDAQAIELRWQAPAGCPQAEQARTLVERLVPGSAAGLRADAMIDAAPGGFTGTLELHAGASPSVRRLHAEDCTVLARAMAVVIAVSLDPVEAAGAGRRATVPEPEPVGPGEGETDGERARADATEPPTADVTREHERPQGSSRDSGSPGQDLASRLSAGDRSLAEPRSARGGLEGGARIGAGVGGLLLPAAGVGLSLAPFLGTARIHVRAVAQYWAPQAVAFDPRRDASGELQLVTGGVRVCPQLGPGFGWSRVRIPLCAGVDAGAVLGRGTGRDLVPPRTARGPWAGAVLEPGITVGVTSRVSLWFTLEGVVSLYRPKFAVEGAPEAWAWTAGAGALRGLFGVQVQAPLARPQNP